MTSNNLRKNIALNKKQIDFITKIANEIKKSSKVKLSKSSVIRSIIKAYMKMNIKTKDVRSEKELEKALIKSLKGGRK